MPEPSQKGESAPSENLAKKQAKSLTNGEKGHFGPTDPVILSPFVDQTVPPMVRQLSTADVRGRRRRVVLPIVLFIATCASTYFAGAMAWKPYLFFDDVANARQTMAAHWGEGLSYMVCVIGILLMHELGHFVQTLRYKVYATYPLFIPMPMVITGTMGAVIGMESARADRRQLFDIGLTGPWAGLVLALPIIWFGMLQATFCSTEEVLVNDFQFGYPLVFDLLRSFLRKDIPPNAVLEQNPLLMAGWVGMLVTGLNMLPCSQLDGGHVIYGLFGQRAKWIARAFVLAAIGFIVISEQYTWTLMLVLVILLGVDHPPTRDDSVQLGPVRTAIGLISLAIPVFCFTPLIL